MTDEPKDGGPAFPRNDYMSPDGGLTIRNGSKGMSMRDWFAGQAMAGTIASGNVGINTTYEDLARVCYRQADAMIAARRTPAPATEENEG